MNAPDSLHCSSFVNTFPILSDLRVLRSAVIAELGSHKFLHECRNGEVGLDRLKSFLVQHGKYSSFFTRYVCQMMANLSSQKEVLRVVDNLFEELGFAGEGGPTHSDIFRDMLSKFEIDLDSEKVNVETQNLIDTMMGFCRQPNGVYGLAALCLGAEAIVPSMYEDIVVGFQRNGVRREDLEFFTIHIECDDGHAETMLEILSRAIQREPEQFETVRHAAFVTIRARMKMLSSI